MRKFLPLFVVIILVLGGLGAVAIPNEKLSEDKPLKVERGSLEIKFNGGFFGYKVTIKNVGVESVVGSLEYLLFCTEARLTPVGFELELHSKEFDLNEGEQTNFRMGPLIGFGRSEIYFRGTIRLEGEAPINFEGDGKGFVLIIFTICDVTPINIL